MVGDKKRGQGRKIWLGTKNMVRDKKYGQGRKNLKKKLTKKKRNKNFE